jgi:uncharacterized protein YaiE (UPF0345 family)
MELTMAITHNSYFDGAVQSLAFDFGNAGATVGVLAPGDHVFNLKARETMTVVAGKMFVTINDMAEFPAPVGTTFDAPEGCTLRMRCDVDTAYLCEFH